MPSGRQSSQEGLTGTEKGELSIQMGCSLLLPGSGEDMMLTDILLSEKRMHAPVLPDQFSNCSCKEIILFTNLPKKVNKIRNTSTDNNTVERHTE